jgi:hypothetical protein
LTGDRSLPPIVQKTLLLLSDAATFDASVEVLIEIINHPQIVHYENSFGDAILAVVTNDAFRAKFAEALHDQDEDYIRQMTRLLVALGETLTTFIIKNMPRSDVGAMLEMLLQVTGYPGYYGSDEDVSELPLNFW